MFAAEVLKFCSMDLVPVVEGSLGPAEKLVRDYVAQAKAPNTLRAYAADWRHFTAWCRSRGFS
jgi:hypothetical protein